MKQSERKCWHWRLVTVAVAGGVLVLLTAILSYAQSSRPSPKVTEENKSCVECHAKTTPGLVKQWEDSRHAAKGIGCLDCHEAEEGEPDAFTHHGETIAEIVTPNDCSMCHRRIAKEFQNSHHAKAAQFVGSLDNVLGEIAEGNMAAVNGCWQCHGSPVRFLKDKAGKVLRDDTGKPRLDPSTWPNTGVGRMNLGGSRGSCTACHSRHVFSKKMARQPEVCGKCHLGPDHPQKEIYDESKHGIAYYTRKSEMNLDSDKWVVGQDYSAAPTCATCHMSATKNQRVTHDVGARLSWTLRPVVSKKLENADAKRKAMQDVCQNCHGPAFVQNFYKQYDASITLYNDKFARPALELMGLLRKKGKLTPTPFDESLEWNFFRLWHHEGRRARMGVSMQGPDYTQWHGFFEVAERFYFEFLPEVEEYAHGDAEILAKIKEIKARDEHRWLKGMSKEEIAKIQEFYKKRYGP